jgi:RNA polymerase sigma-70 factor (ECF subfamily)
MQPMYMNGPYAHESDANLVTQVLAGNREVFGILASRYYESGLRLCVRLLSDPVEAEDVAQEALLQAFLSLNRLQLPERFGSWLHAIASNLARSSLRRRRPEALEVMRQSGIQHE